MITAAQLGELREMVAATPAGEEAMIGEVGDRSYIVMDLVEEIDRLRGVLFNVGLRANTAARVHEAESYKVGFAELAAACAVGLGARAPAPLPLDDGRSALSLVLRLLHRTADELLAAARNPANAALVEDYEAKAAAEAGIYRGAALALERMIADPPPGLCATLAHEAYLHEQGPGSRTTVAMPWDRHPPRFREGRERIARAVLRSLAGWLTLDEWKA